MNIKREHHGAVFETNMIIVVLHINTYLQPSTFVQIHTV